MDREKVIEAFDKAKELVWTDDDEYTVGYNNGLEAGKNIALTLLKEQEAVVRCKDCVRKEKIEGTENIIYCPHVRMRTSVDWFCADVERKTDDA